MKTSASFFLAGLAATTSALPAPQGGSQPPDNTVVKYTPKFNLKAFNIGENQSLFGNDTYFSFFHAGAGNDIAALTPLPSNAPGWYLKGTELFLESGGAVLQFEGTHEQGFNFSVITTGDKDANGFTPYSIITSDNGTPSFGNYTIYPEKDLYVGHMSVSQNAPTYGCKGEYPATKNAIVVKYGSQHVDPVTPEGCSAVIFKVELV